MKNIRFLDSAVNMPLILLPVKTPIVDVGGKEIIISPGSQLKAAQFDPQSPVSDLVAPNLLHSAGIVGAAKIYPNAKIWGVPGLKEKRPNISWTGILGQDVWPYADELPCLLVGGMPHVNEFVFFHRASKSLIVTDLFFNLVNAKGIGAWIIMSMFGTYRRFAISKFFMGSVKDEKAFKASLDEILKWDFENIIVSHGEPIIGNAKEKFQRAVAERLR